MGVTDMQLGKLCRVYLPGWVSAAGPWVTGSTAGGGKHQAWKVWVAWGVGAEEAICVHSSREAGFRFHTYPNTAYH